MQRVSSLRRPRSYAAAVAVVLLVGVLITSQVSAVFHLVQFDEIMTGLDGDTTIQFIEMRMCCGDQNTQPDNAKLVFFDEDGTVFGTPFLFGLPKAKPGTNVSFLIATQAFADLPGSPEPDFIMEPNSLAIQDGQVCYARVTFPVDDFFPNICFSYGAFGGNLAGAGDPAAPLPATGEISLVRFQNFFAFETQFCQPFSPGCHLNGDFQLGDPDPKNSLGETFTHVEAAIPVPGIGTPALLVLAAALAGAMLVLSVMRRARQRGGRAPA